MRSLATEHRRTNSPRFLSRLLVSAGTTSFYFISALASTTQLLSLYRLSTFAFAANYSALESNVLIETHGDAEATLRIARKKKILFKESLRPDPDISPTRMVITLVFTTNREVSRSDSNEATVRWNADESGSVSAFPRLGFSSAVRE